MPKTDFATVEEAVEEIKAGRMVIVVDDEDRENEGDLTLAAEFVTPEAINFMAKFGRGLICLTLTEERADYLRLGPMTQDNTSRFGTAFTESIEAAAGAEGWRAGEGGADGGVGGPRKNGGVDSGGSYLRDHERRRVDGESAGSGEILRGTWNENGNRGRFDTVPVTK
jgi:hypothetical protein